MKLNKTIAALFLAVSVLMLVTTSAFSTERGLMLDMSESTIEKSVDYSNLYSNFNDDSEIFLKTIRADNDMGTGGDAYDSYGASSSATTISQSASGTGNIDISGD